MEQTKKKRPTMISSTLHTREQLREMALSEHRHQIYQLELIVQEAYDRWKIVNGK